MKNMINVFFMKNMSERGFCSVEATACVPYKTLRISFSSPAPKNIDNKVILSSCVCSGPQLLLINHAVSVLKMEKRENSLELRILRKFSIIKIWFLGNCVAFVFNKKNIALLLKEIYSILKIGSKQIKKFKFLWSEQGPLNFQF